MFVEVVEIISLKELVRELSEGKTIACFTVQAFLHRFLRHHVVHRNVLTNVPDEVEELEILHPVIVVHQFCTVGRIAVEIKEM